MNRKLRKMCKLVNMDIVLLSPDNAENLKKNHEEYLDDLDKLTKLINDYLEDTANLFQTWCNVSVEVFSYETSNVFSRMIRFLSMVIVNHYLNKYSYEMSVCGILQNNLSLVRQRLIQYDIFSWNCIQNGLKFKPFFSLFLFIISHLHIFIIYSNIIYKLRYAKKL